LDCRIGILLTANIGMPYILFIATNKANGAEMQQPIEIKATVAAWVSAGYNQKDLLAAIEGGNKVAAINAAALWGSPDQEHFGDYIRIGEADVTLRLVPRDQQVRMAVQALQRQLDDDRAKWLQRQQHILAEISKLQAISYDEAVEA
jgi:hypothetical protein